MRRVIFIFLFCCFNPCTAEEDPFGESDPNRAAEDAAEEKLYKSIEAAHSEYRKDFAEILKKADKVEIHIVTFDKVAERNHFKDDEDLIRIAPYELHTPIIQSKILTPSERVSLLAELTTQISKANHGGGALCHYPVHAMRAYVGDRVIFESTFCWVCGNFGFGYPPIVSPDESTWLDTTPELGGAFEKLLPIPEAELERFYKQHPGVNPKK